MALISSTIRNKKRNAHRRAIAIVETVVVLPLLIVLTFAGLKYGWLFFKKQQITNAARQAARLATQVNWPGTSVAVTEADVRGVVQTIFSNSSIPYDAGDVTVVLPANKRQQVSVQISVPAEKIDILQTSLMPAPPTVGAYVVMSREGSS